MFKLSDWLFSLLRKFLFLWVRTDVIGNKAEKLGLNLALPVVYVLQKSSYSNRLVLEEECLKAGLPSSQEPLKCGKHSLRRRFFFLSEPKGGVFSRREMPLMTGRISELVNAATEDPTLDIQIVPVSIFWGRAPEKEQSLFKLLLSDNWAVSGRLRHFFIILIHGRNTFVQFNRPISLRQLADESTSPSIGSRKLARLLRVHFRLVRQTVVGPDLSHRRTLVSSLVRTPSVKEAIQQTMATDKISEEKAQQKALKYADEIASNVSIAAVRFLHIVLTWVWNKIYNGVTVNHLEPVKEAAQKGGLVYVPCHRSHIDYLLLSYVLFVNGLMVPHIAAGINLNMPIVGAILRRGGAFFMRRSFRDNKLYAAVFNEYMQSMFTKGYPVEYFVEGGRSRTGRTLHPKAGMLNMTIKSYLKDSNKPLIFIPVYVGYEKILEERSYLGELRGKKKEKESILGLFKTLRNLKNHGRVTVNFGAPLKLDDVLHEVRPDWRKPVKEKGGTKWVAQAVDHLANKVAISINEASAINPVNITAAVLLTTPRLAMDANLLAERSQAIVNLLKQRPYSERVTFPDGTGEEWVNYIESMGLARRQKQSLGDIMTLSDSEAILLTYYRNNILHLMALPAMIASLFQNRGSLEMEKVEWLVTAIYPYVRSELFLRWTEESVWQEAQAWLEIFFNNGLLRTDGKLLFRPTVGTREFTLLSTLAKTIIPTIERYYIAIAILKQHGTETLTPDKLEALSTCMAERMSILYGLNAPEFFDKSLFRNFIAQLEKNAFLGRAESGVLSYDERLDLIAEEARLVLNADIRESILQVTSEAAEGEEPSASQTAA